MEYAIYVTDTDSFKKESLLVDLDPRRQWELFFPNVEQPDFSDMVEHYETQHGPHYPFEWTSTPMWLDDGAAIEVRYVSFTAKPHSVKLWEIQIVLEEVL
jgi:hypothetical protein